MESYQLKKPDLLPNHVDIYLASSKSESNRALIINALAKGSNNLSNLSTARDTQTMIRLLSNTQPIADVLDAGTTMRFLTAFFGATDQKVQMTGTPRMCERPIGILVYALKQLGVEIEYLNKENYPPLQINGFKKQLTNKIAVRGDVSSQFISALIMIAPTLPEGLELSLTGDVGSIPYIKMTIAQMKEFGVIVDEDWQNNILKVKNQSYIPTKYAIESDWSGASYWFSVVALADNPNFTVQLMGLKEKSLQGDAAIVEIMDSLGVKSTFNESGVLLSKIEKKANLTYDYANCPDLVQTVVACAAVLGTELILTGIESLKIKETDRVSALQKEVAKFGAVFEEINKNEKYVLKPSFSLPNTPITIETYDDHRMAMAFAPIALKIDVEILEPGVVAKSYPSFWDDIEKLLQGFR